MKRKWFIRAIIVPEDKFQNFFCDVVGILCLRKTIICKIILSKATVISVISSLLNHSKSLCSVSHCLIGVS